MQLSQEIITPLIVFIIALIIGIILIICIYISSSTSDVNPKPDFSNPEITYNSDWIFTIYNNNDQNYRAGLVFKYNTGVYADSVLVPANSSVQYNLFPQVNLFPYNGIYSVSVNFVEINSGYTELSFITPSMDKILTSLNISQFSYLNAEIGDCVGINEDEYQNLISGVPNTMSRGIPTLASDSDLPSQNISVYINDPIYALDKYNYLFAFAFTTHQEMDNSNLPFNFQIILTSNGFPSQKGDDKYINISINQSLNSGTNYYFVIKGSNLLADSDSVLNFWGYPSLLPFGYKQYDSYDYSLTYLSPIIATYQDSTNISQLDITTIAGSNQSFQFLESNSGEWVK